MISYRLAEDLPPLAAVLRASHAFKRCAPLSALVIFNFADVLTVNWDESEGVCLARSESFMQPSDTSRASACICPSVLLSG